MSDAELLALVAALDTRRDTWTHDDAARWLAACAELGARGYVEQGGAWVPSRQSDESG